VEPYVRLINELVEKQREKDSEILVLRYALVEMDRKVMELEKKLPRQGTTGRSTLNANSSRT
jgi:hypothetical protein